MIFSTHPLHPDVTAQLCAAGDYRVASAPTAAAILTEGAGAEVLIVRAPIPPAYFATASGLRAAVRHGAGLDMIPMQAATDAGVLVANVPGVNAATVAEHVIFAAIALRRRFRAVDSALRGTGWAAARALADEGRDLGGATLGIVGMGAVGSRVAALGTAFGCNVLVTTRRAQVLPPGVVACDLDDLVARADVLVLCCPLTDATRGLVSAARIATMRPGAMVINVARGPVVDAGALASALQSGALGGAALDVFDVQPLTQDSPFLALENVILTPHMAGITADSMWRMGQGVVAETLRVLAGDLPLNLCNPKAVPRYRQRFPG